MNKPIQLTEQDLHMLVEDAVRAYLVENGMDEGFWSNLGAAFKPLGQTAKAGINQAGQAAANKIGGAYNTVKNAATQAGRAVGNAATRAGQAVGNAASQTANAMQQNYRASKIQDMRNKLEQMFIQYANYAGAGQNTVNAFNQLLAKIDQNVGLKNNMAAGATNGMKRAFGVRTA